MLVTSEKDNRSGPHFISQDSPREPAVAGILRHVVPIVNHALDVVVI